MICRIAAWPSGECGSGTTAILLASALEFAAIDDAPSTLTLALVSAVVAATCATCAALAQRAVILGGRRGEGLLDRGGELQCLHLGAGVADMFGELACGVGDIAEPVSADRAGAVELVVALVLQLGSR